MSNLHQYRAYEFNFVANKYFLTKGKDAKVLDFGSGDGFIIRQLKSIDFRFVKGVEIFDSNYTPSENSEISFYDGDINNFPALGDFDIIHSSNVLEHLEDPLEYLYFFNNLLTNNGIQVHIVPTHFWKLYNSLFYYIKVLIYLIRMFFISSDNRKSTKSTYKNAQKNNKKESRFFIGRHGARGTSFGELSLFNPKSYKKQFDINHIEYEDFPINLIYSGHHIFGKLINIKLRIFLSKFIGYSCHCFVILKKNEI